MVPIAVGTGPWSPVPEPNYTSSSISQAMLTLIPGQLSTLAGNNNPLGYGDFVTKAFNFADLPCPP